MPASGATLALSRCRAPFDGLERWCTPIDVQFSVTADRSVSAKLGISFLAGEKFCGYALTDVTPLVSGEPATFQASLVYMSLRDDIEPLGSYEPCDLPVKTTRIRTNLIGSFHSESRSFPLEFTFVSP